MDSLQPFVDTAIDAADAARAITTRHFRAALDISDKSDHSPVTAADFEVERRLKAIILERHPSHAVLGEETGAAGDDNAGDNNNEWHWVIDPIDGTKAFATGNPAFGTLVALLRRGRPLIGVVEHAALSARLLGVDGRVTTCNGAECRASAVAALARASLYATSIDLFAGPALAAFERLSAACRFRVFGGDCHCYTLLARGFTDLVCEARLKPHDFLALIPVVEGAGGVITDWHGRALTLHSDGHVLAAANRALHQAALAELNR